jgi:hypothetical protein
MPVLPSGTTDRIPLRVVGATPSPMASASGELEDVVHGDQLAVLIPPAVVAPRAAAQRHAGALQVQADLDQSGVSAYGTRHRMHSRDTKGTGATLQVSTALPETLSHGEEKSPRRVRF